MATDINRDRTHSVNVNFAEGTYRILEELARKQGKTKGDILRDAIALAKYIQDARDDGGRVLVKRRGRTSELDVFRPR